MTDILARLMARASVWRATRTVEVEPEAPTRMLMAAYVAGLALIAMLAVGAYLATDIMIGKQASAASVVNLSGRKSSTGASASSSITPTASRRRTTPGPPRATG